MKFAYFLLAGTVLTSPLAAAEKAPGVPAAAPDAAAPFDIGQGAVVVDGRIIAGYATIHRDDFIPAWAKLGEAVRAHGARYILQLSHSGRQMDLPGVHNMQRASPSPTSMRPP